MGYGKRKGGLKSAAHNDVLLAGEFAAHIAPDAASVTAGWCGGMVRFLRKSTDPEAPSLQCRWGSTAAPCPPLRLPPGPSSTTTILG